MNFELPQEAHQFRQEIRAKIDELLPDDMRERQRLIRSFSHKLDDQRAWMKILDENGLSVPYLPVEYGGKDWTALQKFIFEDELVRGHAPELALISTRLVAPVVCEFGNDEQKERFLPPIRSGEHIWCQGFSEPGAGSDLASLRTNARLEGDHYVLNGGKIWTSGAYEADWGFFLIKTDTSTKAQNGISFLLVDMKSPGIEIRRIPQLNGEAHLSQVFLDNVLVPKENLIGEPGKGWTYAKFLLNNERTSSSFIHWNKREFDRAKKIGQTHIVNGRPIGEDPRFVDRMVRIEADLVALEWSVLRILAGEDRGLNPTAAASVLKVRGAIMQQLVTQIQLDMLGAMGLRKFDAEDLNEGTGELWPDMIPGRASNALIMRAATIYGGTLQVQKNILAKVAFGL